MAYTRKTIDGKEIERQQAICADIFERVTADGGRPLALVDTYGCQQNEADSEKLRGYLAEMGYGFTQDEFQADVIVVNTCAVREHAEMRVLGNVGALNHSKKARPGQIIAVCGCMVQQEHMAQKIKMSYPVVDLVFGPHELWRFPELLLEVMEKHKRVFAAEKNDGAVAEGIPVRRDGKVKAWLSIMYGCNNFCTYCIVPYVRGRERSRLPEDVVAEARELVAAGYKDITLLGQNVNSYGKDLDCGVDFADLIRMINAIPGDFRIRFMTSHPRDATEKLFCTMAACEKCAHHIHLPVQSGSDRILKQMNRHYDRAKYLSEIETAGIRGKDAARPHRRRDRQGGIQSLFPHRRRAACPPQGRSRSDRTVCRRKDRFFQHLGAVWGIAARRCRWQIKAGCNFRSRAALRAGAHACTQTANAARRDRQF